MANQSPADPQPKPITDFELDLLKQEYFFLQTTIEDYNKQIWVIKALGITSTGAVLALMLQQKTNASAIALITLCYSPILLDYRKPMETPLARLLSPRSGHRVATVLEIAFLLLMAAIAPRIWK